jgi:HAD superfamily hydrolase (TIGR01509 family)
MIGEKHKVAAFDFDDCLVATIKNVWDLHKFVAKNSFSVTLTSDQIRDVWGRPLPELVEALYKQPYSVVEPHLLAAKQKYPKEVFPDSIPLLRALKAAGKVVAVVTSTNANSIKVDLEHNQFPNSVIDHLFTVDDCQHYKPDPRVFDPLIDLGYKPEEIIYTGDAASDFFAARDRGIDFIGVATGLLSVKDFERLEGWQEVGAVAVPSIAEVYQAL